MTNRQKYATYFELLQKPISNPTEADILFMEWFFDRLGNTTETLTWLIECDDLFETENIGNVDYDVNYFNSDSFSGCPEDNDVKITLYDINDEFHDDSLYSYCFCKDKLKERREKLLAESNFSR